MLTPYSSALILDTAVGIALSVVVKIVNPLMLPFINPSVGLVRILIGVGIKILADAPKI